MKIPPHHRPACPGTWQVGSDGACEAGEGRAGILERIERQQASGGCLNNVSSHRPSREQGCQGRQVHGGDCLTIDGEA
jgi:hypothetical protein